LGSSQVGRSRAHQGELTGVDTERDMPLASSRAVECWRIRCLVLYAADLNVAFEAAEENDDDANEVEVDDDEEEEEDDDDGDGDERVDEDGGEDEVALV